MKCLHCGLEIKKARTPHRIGGRVWRWATKDGAFYCPSAGGECWHEPEAEKGLDAPPSLRPPLPLRLVENAHRRMTPGGARILTSILQNTNHKYRKPIPTCTDMERYGEAVAAVDRILAAVPMYEGGSDAVLGWLRYFGVLNDSGGFRKSK